MNTTLLKPAPIVGPEPLPSVAYGGGSGGGSGDGGNHITTGGGSNSAGAQLPVYIVSGVNWSCEIAIDEFNAQFEQGLQLMEAATRAVEVFKGVRTPPPELILFPHCQGQKPQMGTVLLVTLKGGDPKRAAVIYTHVCLANTGFYADSVKMEQLFLQQHQQALALQAESLKQQEAAAREVAVFQQARAKMLAKQKGLKSKKRTK